MEHISEKKPLPLPNIKLLEKILRGIIKGELPYDHKHRHNKEAHTIGGWAEVYQYKDLGYTYDPEEGLFVKEDDSFKAYDGYGYNKLMAILGLTPQEATIISYYPPPFDMQFKLLDLLKRNIRIKGYFVEEDLAAKEEFRICYYQDNQIIFPPDDPDPPVLIRRLHAQLFNPKHD